MAAEGERKHSLHQTARQIVPSDVPVSPIDYVNIAGALGVGQSVARLFLRKIEWSFRESRETQKSSAVLARPIAFASQIRLPTLRAHRAVAAATRKLQPMHRA